MTHETEGSGGKAAARIAPGDRRSLPHPERCEVHERRSMPSDLLGETHQHKRVKDKWPCRNHRRHGDPPPTPGRFDKRFTDDEFLEHMAERDERRRAGDPFCDVCSAERAAPAAPEPQGGEAFTHDDFLEVLEHAGRDDFPLGDYHKERIPAAPGAEQDALWDAECEDADKWRAAMLEPQFSRWTDADKFAAWQHIDTLLAKLRTRVGATSATRTEDIDPPDVCAECGRDLNGSGSIWCEECRTP